MTDSIAPAASSYRARKRGFAPFIYHGVEIKVIFKDKKSVLIEIVPTEQRHLITRQEFDEFQRKELSK